MKQYLLSAICLATAASLSAAGTPEAISKSAAPSAPVLKVKTGEATRMLAPGVYETVRGGLRRIDDRRASRTMKVPAKAQLNAPSFLDPSEYTFFEGFEGWDTTDSEWLPEGWTIENKVDRYGSWKASAPYYNISPAEGNVFMGAGLNYPSDFDEWLITPEIEVAAGDELSFYAFYQPMYLFSQDNIDWNTFSYVGDPIPVADYEVFIKAEGDQEWTRVFSAVEKYRTVSLEDIIYGQMPGPEKHTGDISSFAGKKARIAFRYSGTEGDAVFLDAVSVGKPTLEDISYMNPFEILYWGTDGTLEGGCFPVDLGFLPVNTPITWSNMSPYDPNVTYSWEYSDPSGDGLLTSDDPDGLTVTYLPDNGYKELTGPNMHTFPVLSATKEGYLNNTHSSGLIGFQAGGAPEATFTSGEVLKVGVLPYPLHRDLSTYVTVDYEEVGDFNCPIFGHDKNTDDWWLKKYAYQMDDDDPAEGEYSRLIGIFNFIYLTDQPLVVNGAHVMAYGEISPEAEFTLSFYGLPASMEFDFESEPVAKAVCKGSDVIAEYTGRRSEMVLPFSFESPVALKMTDEYPYYIVMLTGFNSEAVSYFAPKQSYYPSDLCHGFLLKDNNIQGRVGKSIMAMAAIEGEEGQMMNSFAICLDAEYPWLSTDCEAITLPADGTPVEVKLNSFYDASKLAVTVPVGVEYTISGGYPTATLTLAHNAATVIAEGDVTITSPGHSISIPLTEESGIADITAAEGATVKGIYDLSGRRIDPTQAKAGVYVIRYTDGSAVKRVIR
ncbi:MAG: choice-of-anchor J domain-containing protein [Muribaculaceae bacterium]|nr:choice-of-anchor J domain-containing protein [Muribaculaceae bacterium]